MEEEYPILYDIIKKHEGLRQGVYQCPSGIWTIGWGHTGKLIHHNTKPISIAQAEQYLKDDVYFAMMHAVAASPILKDHYYRRMAVTDFIFNCGINNYRASTLKKKVDAEDWKGAVSEIRKWVHSNGRVLQGLVKRREQEAELLLKD